MKLNTAIIATVLLASPSLASAMEMGAKPEANTANVKSMHNNKAGTASATGKRGGCAMMNGMQASNMEMMDRQQMIERRMSMMEMMMQRHQSMHGGAAPTQGMSMQGNPNSNSNSNSNFNPMMGGPGGGMMPGMSGQGMGMQAGPGRAGQGMNGMSGMNRMGNMSPQQQQMMQQRMQLMQQNMGNMDPRMMEMMQQRMGNMDPQMMNRMNQEQQTVPQPTAVQPAGRGMMDMQQNSDKNMMKMPAGTVTTKQ